MLAYAIILQPKSSKISHVLRSDYNLKMMRRSTNDTYCMVLSTYVLDDQLSYVLDDQLFGY